MSEMNVSNDFFDVIQMVAGTVAHEIRNPLMLAQVSLDYILLDDMEKKYEEFYSLIKTSLQRVAEITATYDDIWKPGCAREKIAAHPFLWEIVRKYQIINPQIHFEMICPGENACFISNRKKLEIVLSNVVKNAVESIGNADSGRIEVIYIEKDDRGALVCTDNGHGLCAEALEKLNRGASFTTKKYGHGLGLCISRGIMEGLGGALTLENRTGGGCTATLTLGSSAYGFE